MVVVVVAMIDNGDVDCEYGDGELDSSGYCQIFNLPHPHCPLLLGQLSSTGWDIVFQIRVVNVKEIEALLQHHFQGAVHCAKNHF